MSITRQLCRTTRHTLFAVTTALLLVPLARSGMAQEQPTKAERPAEASARYEDWQHSGSLYILTTPEGRKNLPATASEDNFPLLVRLDKDWFDFSQAKAYGEDIRFASGGGLPLAYEIDAWDAAGGKAGIWVRVPAIKGNARQEIKLYWGKPDAMSESSGRAVFNESNGYLSVWHMNDPVEDVVGTLPSKDAGTTAVAGVVGPARHFPGKAGIFCGDKIPNYPSAASPHSTEMWFRAEATNTTLIGWGNEGGNSGSKVRMQLRSPPHVHVDSDFADVFGTSVLPMSQWFHVTHTYDGKEGRVYINGQLDGAARQRLAIKRPGRLWIGGWYGNYDFIGDIDEVRVSRVARSAEWVRMEYENQKPLQTLAGPLLQAGSGFSVSHENIDIRDGTKVALTAKAGGAQKVYWILKREGRETVAAVDRFHFTFDAGRVAADESLTIRFKAVYADGVKTRDIPVTIKKTIPDPIFTLKAPARWDGGAAIDVVAEIANLAEMQAQGGRELKYGWTCSGMAVIKEVAPGKLLLKRAQNSGPLNVHLAISNGGTAVKASIAIMVKEPKQDAWVERTPDKDEKPVDNQFYARDDKNEGTLYYNGTLNEAAEAVFLKVYADDRLFKSESQALQADKTYSFSVKLKPGLIKYKVEFGTKSGNRETVLHTAGNLLCGDAYIIEGQSNAEATAPGRETTTNPWVRTYNGGWGDAVRAGTNWWIGYWGMDLAANLVTAHRIPICIINGAVGGTRIDEHLRNESSHADPNTIYGRLLARIEGARLTHGIRGVLWHQGEADQGTLGPTGDYDYKSYQQYFVDLSAAWKEDYPNIRNYYVFQIWPNACTDPSANDMLREVQRTLPYLYSNMRIMTTLGVVPGSSCHYLPAGYARFAALMGPLVERDNYGKVFDKSITPPDLKKAYYASERKDEIVLEFDQPMAWNDSASSQFYLDGQKGRILEGAASGSVVRLKLPATDSAKTITYLVGQAWNGDQTKLLYGQNGIAALTFCAVPLEFAKPKL